MQFDRRKRKNYKSDLLVPHEMNSFCDYQILEISDNIRNFDSRTGLHGDSFVYLPGDIFFGDKYLTEICFVLWGFFFI